MSHIVNTQQGQEAFLSKAYQAASDAGIPFPEIQICETAEESGYGSSALAMQCNNLFGQKQGKLHPLAYPQRKFMTNEWDKKQGKMVLVPAYWLVFPNWKTSFVERMNLLRRLSSFEPGYAAGLRIADAQQTNDADASTYETNMLDFVRQVSSNWSTDPERADKVIGVYNTHKDFINSLKGVQTTNA